QRPTRPASVRLSPHQVRLRPILVLQPLPPTADHPRWRKLPRKQRVALASAMRRRAGPLILLSPLNHPRPHWVALHVPYCCPQLCTIQRAGEVTVLPQAPSFSSGAVHRQCKTSVRPTKALCQGGFRFRHNHPVDRIAHQTICPHVYPVALGVLLHHGEIVPAGLISVEYHRTPITALHHVMGKTWNHHSRQSSHEKQVYPA